MQPGHSFTQACEISTRSIAHTGKKEKSFHLNRRPTGSKFGCAVVRDTLYSIEFVKFTDLRRDASRYWFGRCAREGRLLAIGEELKGKKNNRLFHVYEKTYLGRCR